MKCASFLLIIYIVFVLMYHIYLKLNQVKLDKNILVVVALEGFRDKYIKYSKTPALFNFGYSGFYSKYVKRMWPEQMPTEESSVGLESDPKQNGVFEEEYFLLDENQNLHYQSTLYHINEKIIPIWILNQQRGGVSACMMWPGSDLHYGRDREKCSMNVKYDPAMPLNKRMETITNWIQISDNKYPNLIMFYIEEPGKAIKLHGLKSKEVQDEIQKVDQFFYLFLRNLENLGLRDHTNIVVIGDTSMHPVSSQFQECRKIPIYDANAKTSKQNRDILYNPFNLNSFVTNNNRISRLYGHKYQSEMNRGVCKLDFKIGTKQIIEKVYQAPLIFHEELESTVTFSDARKVKGSVNTCTNQSEFEEHEAWEDDYESKVFFMARGPEINPRNNYFEMIDVYGLFAELLHINGTYNDSGNMARVISILRDPAWLNNLVNETYLGLMIISFLLGCMKILAESIRYTFRQQQTDINNNDIYEAPPPF